MSQKASDLSAVPLTREEHVEYHQIGKHAFEEKFGLDFDALVKRLNSFWFTARKWDAA